MAYFTACAAVFFSTYLLNIFYITVLYHRGLTHGAVRLRPFTRILLQHTGSWVTGLDPKGWACMHRLHHLHSDTPLDPHSPSHNGLFEVMLVQLRSYNRILVKLIKRAPKETALMRDVEFDVGVLNRRRLWLAPYLLHVAVALVFGFVFHAWLMGAAYWLGMMSHPIQGWMVNALAHKFGYRNFETNDDSRNNTMVALLVMGEGYQNNHHHAPRAAKFSVKPSELDLGFFLCVVAEKLGMIEIVDAEETSLALPQNTATTLV
jgi:stearoyl-CoA desaturase (delta-9 desaturase)